MEMVTRLYNQVDEEVHRLVLLSNKSLQYLESILAMRKFEEGCDQVSFHSFLAQPLQCFKRGIKHASRAPLTVSTEELRGRLPYEGVSLKLTLPDCVSREHRRSICCPWAQRFLPLPWAGLGTMLLVSLFH